ncbi:MAG TPA: Sec-independent protein translocase protein TatB [Woeseiaceae bacterium]|nr:Sec-independent protein translocase protein TatB [Woeseiaceae bacterium]
MSGVSFWELLLIFVIGLVVLGPERLPRVANQLGTWVGQARRMTRVLRRQLEDELNFEKETIRPRTPTTTAKTAVKALPHVPANEHDNTWSPAHDAGSPGTGISPPERNVDNDFADTDVLDESVKQGTKTSDEVGSPDRNSAANTNT